MMKWWGWGDERLSFPMESKPDLWPWIRGKLGLTHDKLSLPVTRESIKLPPPVLNEAFCREVQGTSDETERLLHSYGKSFPDLLKVRRGIVSRAPDMVVYPDSHEEVERIMAAANRHGVTVVPFGGGTNIVGGVNPEEGSRRMVVTIDMRKMNRLIALDPLSRTATIQAGALGPKLEADLQAQGHSLGHYPDSFEYSTLGGWIATRSAGMQSDAYGKIEDMIVSVKLVTPSGTIVTKVTPASSAGPDLNRLVAGSEGVLGVITEATMRVHPVPEVKDYRGFLFKSFEDGVAGIYECLVKGVPPSLIRLQDSGETELAFHMKSPKKGLEGFVQRQVKKYLKRKGYVAPCIMIVGFEGDELTVQPVRNRALAILRAHGAFPLGKSVGKTWSADKFNIPYLRDYVMDRGCMADVAETATVWSNVVPLYHATIKAVREKFDRDEKGSGYIGCHISHTYQTGACLYFTVAAEQKPGRELEHYYSYKNLLTETFLECGATLTHHHAVGKEHRPWIEQEISPAGIRALGAMKKALDPNGICNPGKLLPDSACVDTARAVDAPHERRAPADREMPHYMHERPVETSGNNDPLATL